MIEDRHQLKNHRNREMRKGWARGRPQNQTAVWGGASCLTQTSLAPFQLIWDVTTPRAFLCQSPSGVSNSKRGEEAWQRQEGAVSVLSAKHSG